MNWRLSPLFIAAVALAAALGSDAGSASRDAAPKALVFKLKEKNDSRISGTATLSATRSGLRVVLRLAGRLRDGGYPAHIHTGSCRIEPTFANPRIWLSLIDVARGKSVTVTALTSLKQLRARTFSINVHDPSTLGAVACGDIPRKSRP